MPKSVTKQDILFIAAAYVGGRYYRKGETMTGYSGPLGGAMRIAGAAPTRTAAAAQKGARKAMKRVAKRGGGTYAGTNLEAADVTLTDDPPPQADA
ncbi:MAG: hypothetical protein Kilf2KO_44530 [Rhodospirillales bacterium]